MMFGVVAMTLSCSIVSDVMGTIYWQILVLLAIIVIEGINFWGKEFRNL
jgi:hypothetical protein